MRNRVIARCNRTARQCHCPCRAMKAIFIAIKQMLKLYIPWILQYSYNSGNHIYLPLPGHLLFHLAIWRHAHPIRFVFLAAMPNPRFLLHCQISPMKIIQSLLFDCFSRFWPFATYLCKGQIAFAEFGSAAVDMIEYFNNHINCLIFASYCLNIIWK